MSAVIVLGMHFSGTSCLAEALIGAGVNFGKNLRKGSGYPTYEDKHVVDLHVTLMPWDNPRVFVPTPTAQQRAESIVRSFKGEDFGFKEPSAMFFTTLWEKAVRYPSTPPKSPFRTPITQTPQGTVRYVGTFRHPSFVIGHAKEMGLARTTAPMDDLWRRYAQRLLDLHRRNPFPLVCFDDEESVYQAALTRAVKSVCGPSAEAKFNPACRESSPSEPASPESLALYEELKAAASA